MLNLGFRLHELLDIDADDKFIDERGDPERDEDGECDGDELVDVCIMA